MSRACRLAAGALLLAAAGCGSDGGASLPPVVDDPWRAEVVTEDLGRFWEAYDAGGREGAADPVQRLYLDRASPGLRDFLRVRPMTAGDIARAASARRAYLDAVRGNVDALASPSSADALRAVFARLKAAYPPAVFPRTTFVVGRFATGGTVGAAGLYLGAELMVADAAAPTAELTAWERAHLMSLADVPAIAAHELVHVQQLRAHAARAAAPTLLEAAFAEGSADFVGELASGRNVDAWLRDYALPREAALWAEFQAEMNGTSLSRWLYGPSDAAGRPGDLGYFIGYRIAEAYHARAADKAAAVRDLVEVSDVAALLAASGYRP